MSAPHFLGKVSLRAIVVQHGKVLIARDVNDVDTWEIPGGRLDEGETVAEGMMRELKEELGIEVPIGPMIYSEQFHQTRDGSLHLMLTSEVVVDPGMELKFTLQPTEVAEVKWIDRSEFGQYKLYDNCERALKAYWNLT